MRANKRLLIILTAALTLMSVVALVSCTRRSTPAIHDVRIGSFSIAIDYAPYLVSKSKGWFADEYQKDGITHHFTTFETLPSINESFATGNVDIVFEAEPPAIIGRAAGIDIRIMGISCSLTQEIVVSTRSTIKSILDLKGK